jgi:hypothetical protein
MEYGEIRVAYTGGTIEHTKAVLDRSTMPDSLINDLSGEFGWKSSDDRTALVNHEANDGLHFMRSVRGTERSDIQSLISDHDERDDQPGQMMVMNNDTDGWYRAVYHKKAYDVNANIDTVKYEDGIVHSIDRCEASKAICAASWLGATVSAQALVLTCGGIVLTAGGSTPGCILSAGGFALSAPATVAGCHLASTCEDN